MQSNFLNQLPTVSFYPADDVPEEDREALQPYQATQYAASVDLRYFGDKGIVIKPGETKTLRTGQHVNLTAGMVGLVSPRSGLAPRNITIPNSPGIIDPDYSGEILVTVHNGGKTGYTLKPFERFCQLTCVLTLAICGGTTHSRDVRGDGGFGSTGKK